MPIFNKMQKGDANVQPAKKKEPRQITKIEALILLLLSVGILIANSLVWKLGTAMGLAIAALCLILYGILVLGHTWEGFWESSLTAGRTVLPVFYIILLCGVVQAAWMMGGTVPMFMYYGLKLLTPSSYLVVTFVVCFWVGVLTGNGWGTMFTVGLALVNVGNALGVPIIYSVGAIVGGSMNGDRWSPLVDTFNLAAASAKADPVEMWRSMLPSSLIGFGISTILFFIIGQGIEIDAAAGVGDIPQIMSVLSSNFNFNVFLLLPLLVFIVLQIYKVDTAPTYFISSVVGLLCGCFFQGVSLSNGLSAFWNGYVANTGDTFIDEMLSQGGFVANSSLLLVLLVAFLFAGAINRLDMLNVLMADIAKRIHNAGTLVATCTLTCVMAGILSASAYVSVLLNAEIYKGVFKKMKLAPKVLGRTLAEGGGFSTTWVPWGVTGAVIAAILMNGEWTWGWIPFCFGGWIPPLVHIILTYLNINVPKIEYDENPEQVGIKQPQ